MDGCEAVGVRKMMRWVAVSGRRGIDGRCGRVIARMGCWRASHRAVKHSGGECHFSRRCDFSFVYISGLARLSFFLSVCSYLRLQRAIV